MSKPFDPNAGKEVSKSEAMTWIDKYDKEMRKDKDADTRSIFFGKDVLLKMLEGKSAGISVFLGLKYSDDVKKEVVNLVLVPTTEDGTLMWGGVNASVQKDAPPASFDYGTPCPPYCAK